MAGKKKKKVGGIHPVRVISDVLRGVDRGMERPFFYLHRDVNTPARISLRLACR